MQEGYLDDEGAAYVPEWSPNGYLDGKLYINNNAKLVVNSDGDDDPPTISSVSYTQGSCFCK